MRERALAAPTREHALRPSGTEPAARGRRGSLSSASAWLGRPDLDLARQGPGRHAVEVQHRLGDVLWLDLPGVRVTNRAVVELGSDRAGQDRRDAHALLTQVQHRGLREPDQAELAGVVRGAPGEEVDAGQAGDRDDHAARVLESLGCGLDREEDAGEVRVYDSPPRRLANPVSRPARPYPGVRCDHAEP